MATKTPRPVIAGFISADFQVAAGESIVVPVFRSASKNGDSTLAIAAPVGTVVKYCIEHPHVVMAALKGQSYLSSVAGDYPATPNPNLAVTSAAYWATAVTLAANQVFELKQHATCLYITSPSAGRVLLFGDY